MNKQEVMAKVALNEKDTGSPEVQVALLTAHINELNNFNERGAGAMLWVPALCFCLDTRAGRRRRSGREAAFPMRSGGCQGKGPGAPSAGTGPL